MSTATTWRPNGRSRWTDQNLALVGLAHRGGVERRHQLEVVVVRIGEGRDPHVGVLIEVVGLADDDRAGGLEAIEVALDVVAVDVPDQPSGMGVLAVDLAVRTDVDDAAADLPA